MDDHPPETPPHPEVEAVIANITQLMNEVELMLADSTSQHAEDQVELLGVRCDNLKAQLAACYASAGRAVSTGVQRADRTIRDHPYESLVIALGAGLLCGLVLGRRKT